jgi:hypothetical protein
MLQAGDRQNAGGPKVKITIPRMELVAAVNSVRLAKKTREALRIPLAGTRLFTDSSAVLGMLRMESGKFNEFVGARVSEVKVNSDVEGERRWLEGNCNPADLGMRSNATPQDMASKSEYKMGKPWMAEPEGTWPCKKSFSTAPEEEFRKDMLEGACNVVKELQQSPGKEDDFPVVEKGGLKRLVRVFGLVMATVYRWRKKKGAMGPIVINSNGKGQHKLGYLFFIMYFSLPENIPPRPLGGTRVRKHWSAIVYIVITDLHVYHKICFICFVYVHIIVSMNKQNTHNE